MASKSAQQAGENPDVVEEQLEALDKLLDRLKVLYEQYFLGMLKQPPTFIHTDVERKIRDIHQMQIRNTALRYRFVTLQQKFGAYNAYWKRTLRQIEKGTYIRNLVKVSKRAALGEDIPEEILAAMPKRMREQVRKDREAARARARQRPGTNGLGADDFDIDVDDLSNEPVATADDADSAAFVNEPSELRRQARAHSNRHVIEESEDDFDFDAFFKEHEEDESTGIRSIPKPDPPPGPAPKPVPLARATAPGMPAARPPAPPAAQPAEPPARQHLRTPVAGIPVPQRTTQPQRTHTDLDFNALEDQPPPPPRRSAPMNAQPDPNTPPPQRRSQPVMATQPDPNTPPPQRRSQPVMAAQPDPTARPAMPMPARPQTPPAGTPTIARPQTPPAGMPMPARPQTPLPVKPPVLTYPKPTPASGVPSPRANERTPAAGVTIPPPPSSVPIPAPKRAMPSVPAPPPRAAAPQPTPTPTPTPEPEPGPPDRPSQRPLLRPPSVLRRQGLSRPPSAPGKTPPPEKKEEKLKPPPGMSDADVNALYAKYVKAKEMVGETTGPGSYGKLLQTINSQAPKIMEQYKSKGVDFSVVVKDNQVIIKAKPK